MSLSYTLYRPVFDVDRCSSPPHASRFFTGITMTYVPNISVGDTVVVHDEVRLDHRGRLVRPAEVPRPLSGPADGLL